MKKLLTFLLCWLAFAPAWAYKHGSTAAPQTADWHTLHVGNGGEVNGISFAPSDGTMVAWGNEYGAYGYDPSCANPGNAGGTGCFKQVVTAASMPSSLIQPLVNQPNFNGTAIYTANSNTNVAYMFGNNLNPCLFVTTNKWATWTGEANFGCSVFVGTTGGTLNNAWISIDPQNPAFVFVGTNGNGLFWTKTGTTPSSATWTQVSTGQLPVGSYNNVAFNPGSAVSGGFTQGLWASAYGQSGGAIYYSSNAGANFTQIGGPVDVQKLYVDPNNVLYVLDNSSQVWKCTTTACSTTTFPTAAGGRQTVGVAVDPSNANHIALMQTYEGIFAVTCNGGTSWTTAPVGATPVSSSQWDVPWMANESSLWTSGSYIGFYDAIFDLSGNLWGINGIGLFESTQNTPSCSGSTVLSNNISNNTWTGGSAASEELVPLMQVSPTGGCPIFTFWDKALFKVCPNFSTNAADYPTNVNINLNYNIRDAEGVDWVPGTSLIVADTWSNIGNGGPLVQYSTDGGSTFTSTSALPSEAGNTYFGGPFAAASTTNWVWSLGRCGDPFYTTDAGVSWTVINLPSGIAANDCGWQSNYFPPHAHQSLIADKVNGAFYLVYAGTAVSQGIFKSFGGQNWTRVYTGTLPSSGGHRTIADVALRPNPITAGQFLAYEGNTGYSNEQTAWQCIDSSPATLAGTVTCTLLSNLYNSYAVDWGAPNSSTPSQASMVYYGGVGTSNPVGAYYSDNDGASWNQIGNNVLQGSAINGVINIPGYIAGDNNNHATMYICWIAYSANGCSYYH